MSTSKSNSDIEKTLNLYMSINNVARESRKKNKGKKRTKIIRRNEIIAK